MHHKKVHYARSEGKKFNLKSAVFNRMTLKSVLLKKRNIESAVKYTKWNYATLKSATLKRDT